MEFKFRANNIDYYLELPAPELDPPFPPVAPGGSPPKVPIIRVFGATEYGQKVCAHIHGVFPYLYIPYHGEDLRPDNTGVVQTALRRLHHSIDYAMNASFRQPGLEKRRMKPFVSMITLVKGVPFYGFHVGWQFYCKIYLFDPRHMSRLAKILRSGAVLKRVFQPYEAHISNILQFMTDYNIYGCGFIRCSKVRFRERIPTREDVGEAEMWWHDELIPEDAILDSNHFPRQSVCSVEVDIHAKDILNRESVVERHLHHDFIERMSPLSPDLKLVHSLAELWRDEERRRDGRPVSQGLTSATADPRESHDWWLHEERYRDDIKQLIKEEKCHGDGHRLKYNQFVKKVPFEGNIKTALESVKDFFFDEEEGQDAMAPSSQSFGKGKEKSVEEEAVVDVDLIEDDFTDMEEDPVVEEKLVNKSKRKGETDQCSVEDHFPRAVGSINDKVDDLLNVHKSHENMHDNDKINENDINGDCEDYKDGFEVRVKRSPKISAAVVTGEKNPKFSVASQSPHASASRSKLPLPITAFSFEPASSGSTPFQSQKTPKRPMFPPSSQPMPFPAPLASAIRTAFPNISCSGKVFVMSQTSFPPGPSYSDEIGLEYQEPFYSNPKDVPKIGMEYGGREYKIKSNKAKDLLEFNPAGLYQSGYFLGSKEAPVGIRHWMACPDSLFSPRAEDVTRRMADMQKREDGENGKSKEARGAREASRIEFLSQIEGPTQKNKHGFKYEQLRSAEGIKSELQHMSLMSLSVHVNTRGKLVPDPEKDVISCIFYCFQSTMETVSANKTDGWKVGIVVNAGDEDVEMVEQSFRRQCGGVEVIVEKTEIDLITTFVDMVHTMDPDILTGYEVHSGSWGYFIERAKFAFEMSLCDELSRAKANQHSRFGKDKDPWGFSTAAGIKVTGRHLINIWRAMSRELNLLSYTMENVVFHFLNKRIPHYSFQTLTNWYQNGNERMRHKVLKYYVSRTEMNLEILEKEGTITRTSEQARLLGIDFYSVFGRGSQFKVESLMFRIAKPENFMLVSPSKDQVGSQSAAECLPLVMEPKSDFYTSPVVVLDFQSLYPSLMIAYNYCYSTCLGRTVGWLERNRNKMGFTNLKRPHRFLELCEEHINIAPNGMMYLKPHIRKSLLAKMLTEILDTRVMIKNSMKVHKGDKKLQALLNNRQLALKLIANVTYGYTSASFSGRMPCAEIADSIVQSGRETLEKAIEMIHGESKWNAEVVYGDTDSLFIHLKGRTKEEAFRIGQEIADRVTEANPRPMKLKFEKVYLPCILMAKKRYVGFKYEYLEQEEPEFEAKGIETVRRDGTPAEQKIEEVALKILFRTKDLSQVKAYCEEQWTKILQGKVSIQDFCFAKEVKLGSYAEGAPPPPGAKLAAIRMAQDPRNEPQYGERYPYVVIAGQPKMTLSDRVVEVEWLLHSKQLSLDTEYYIRKNIIPPLQRIFSLVGVNVKQWYEEMPKFQWLRKVSRWADWGAEERKGGPVIEAFLERAWRKCEGCGEDNGDGKKPLCEKCLENPSAAYFRTKTKLGKLEKKVLDLQSICRSCEGDGWGEEISCDSQACQVYYDRIKKTNEYEYKVEQSKPIFELLETGGLDW
ncbi:DNA polymerase zeta [Rhizina undulata]